MVSVNAARTAELLDRIRVKEREVYDLEVGIAALRSRSHKAQEELLQLQKERMLNDTR